MSFIEVNSEVERVSTQMNVCRNCDYLHQQIVQTRGVIQNTGYKGNAPNGNLFDVLALHREQIAGFELYSQICECQKQQEGSSVWYTSPLDPYQTLDI